ncbi:hypothetical protein LSAT2_007244 [Lamellibrachia satsuma]|nr:hypothetical protein LSAT2_007244 [Lamellibrachia satsuma]
MTVTLKTLEATYCWTTMAKDVIYWSKAAGDVSAAIIDLFYSYGPPQCVLSDQGREFINELNDHILKAFGVRDIVLSDLHDMFTFQEPKAGRIPAKYARHCAALRGQRLRLLTDYAALASACPGVVETLLIQAKRACETTIITGLYSTETLYLVPDNLRKLSSLLRYVAPPFVAHIIAWSQSGVPIVTEIMYAPSLDYPGSAMWRHRLSHISSPGRRVGFPL